MRRGKSWLIRWRPSGKSLWLSLGELGVSHARLRLAEVNLALAGASEWPVWARDLPAVKRFLDSFGPKSSARVVYENIISDYLAVCDKSPKAQQTIRSRLGELSAWAKPEPIEHLSAGRLEAFLFHVTRSKSPEPGLAQNIFDRFRDCREISCATAGQELGVSAKRASSVMRTRTDLYKRVGKGLYAPVISDNDVPAGVGRSINTRNRFLADLRTFYGWVKRQGIRADNPAEEIGWGKVELPEEIVWCDREERDRLIEAARGMGPAEDLAAVIAFYSGLRRGEIARLRWADVDLGSGWISVGRVRATQTKTGRARTVPIFAALRERLEAIPAERRTGRVIAWPAESERWNDAALDYLDRLRAALPELAAAGKIGFNCWRHTFCSLLAQTGKLSIDQIASISGHTPEVCRRHYAHLIPRDRAALGVELD